MQPNGCVYETFGISKRFPFKLQLLLIRAVPLDKPLTDKCFIHDVSRSVLFFRSFFFQFATSFLSAVRSDRHTFCQVLTWESAGATWQCVWLLSVGILSIQDRLQMILHSLFYSKLCRKDQCLVLRVC